MIKYNLQFTEALYLCKVLGFNTLVDYFNVLLLYTSTLLVSLQIQIV